MYSVAIFGNVDKCRTEVEISDVQGTVLAVVYEAADGWHTDILVEPLNQSDIRFKTAVEKAKENLSHFVNRRGENPPENATQGELSLWLMVKDGGTEVVKTGKRSANSRAWFLISGALMFAAAYSVGRWLAALGTISGWTGLPQHESEIPNLLVQERFWEALALILPFAGAIFVWVGRQKPFDRTDIAGFVLECCLCVAASILGTIAFLLCMLALGTLLYKLE